MIKSKFISKLAMKRTTVEAIAKKLIKNPKLLRDILNGFVSDNANVKFKSAKVLVLIGKEKPELLYPYFDFFMKHLDNKNNILKWNAMDIIAYLTPVDSEKKFDKSFNKYYSMLYEGSLVTAGHIVAGSAVIVRAKPYLEEKITTEILQMEKFPLPTEECRNILKGHAIKTFDTYFDNIKNRDEVIDFVRQELNNTRNATRKKAEKFMAKWSESKK
ncbi:MAG: hypothetical protein JSV97_03060 [candidate division WOR-3 bacterium]|nr:MAG: hypothetical protein JSV97_03060 [candidate division WOR-3 bacterium]